MEPLRGPKQLVLQAVHELQGGSANFVEDRTVAGHLGMDLTDVRNCFMALEERGYLNVALLINGKSALITADGRLALRQYEVSPDEEERRAAHRPEVAVRPKGLLSFDHRDADFFLQLLPGPRDNYGLPDSLLYWKSRIEEADRDQTFRVGVIYGPSGCGKTSLVKAGLLPRLASHVLPVYVEATPGDTEARLLIGLRRVFPDLSADLGLDKTIEALTNSPATFAGNKVLLVIDQFEQWLSASQLEENAELVTALRRCDGVRLQAVIMVRDDFSMALFRFMKQLEIELRQSRNFFVVDLFDLRHAERVLVAFGRAFGALPANDSEMTETQREFVNRATLGLSHDGKVVAVRLALFAEMVRGKEWTPRLLKEGGGTDGVGTAFLEQTFSSRQANPAHRIHQRAAQAVLSALLPDTGTDIKGNMQSYGKLAEASGYARRPLDFEELLRILDSEVRLITPTDSEGVDEEGQQAPTIGRYYQLTHDYLVHSLREWLTRKQKETRKGRAELRLADRAAAWNAKPENRHLPAWWEWVNIRLLTRQKDWTLSQRELMRRAGRYHGGRGVALGVVLLAVTLVVLWGRVVIVEQNKANRAAELVKRLLDADIAQVPDIIREMEGYRQWTDPLLRKAYADANSETVPNPLIDSRRYSQESYEDEKKKKSRQKLSVGLALLPVDSVQVKSLYDRLLNAEPQEVAIIIKALAQAGHDQELRGQLWAEMDQPKKGHEGQRLRAACALAAYDPKNDLWDRAAGLVAEQLVSANAAFLSYWVEGLRPVKANLLAALAAVFRDPNEGRAAERSQATGILADYAADSPDLLVDLLQDADPKQFVVMFNTLVGPDRTVADLLPENGRVEEDTPTSPKRSLRWQRAVVSLTETIKAPLALENSDKEKEAMAKRQANAAVALLRMGEPAEVWRLLQRHPWDDPRVRSYLIHRLGPLGAEPGTLIKRLDKEHDVSVRRALLLAMGEFREEELPQEERGLLLSKLFGLYRDDPDPGLHAAADWLLRTWQQAAWLRQANDEWAKDKDWREKRLQGIQQLRARDKVHPQWYVTSQAHTMVVLPGPVEFLMGSPPGEKGRFDDEAMHRKRIGRSFAIAAKSVTVEEYRRCFKSYTVKKRYAPTADCPAIGISWYEAAAYCNWLSDQEGIEKKEWCYETDADGVVTNLKEEYLRLSGYRLPTEAECEYACRAGAVTSRYYGESEELLGKYGWYVQNAGVSSHPVGMKKPNDVGLFDMHGNVWNWCQESYQPYPKIANKQCIEDKEDDLIILPTTYRVLHGGAFNTSSDILRSAFRLRDAPKVQSPHVGFRPARTFP